MTKIITYTDKKGCFSRRNDGKKDIIEKRGQKSITEEKLINAEEELNQYLSSGWTLLSTSTYMVGVNMIGSTVASFTMMTVVLYKED